MRLDRCPRNLPRPTVVDVERDCGVPENSWRMALHAMSRFQCNRRRWRLFTLMVLALVCAPALANPALWKIQSPTATVYLFGTIHVLPVGAQWHYPALDGALAASSVLYVEEDDDSPAQIWALVRRAGYVPWHTPSNRIHITPYPTQVFLYDPVYLSSELSATDRARLNKAAESASLPGGSVPLEFMKPWLAALTLINTPTVNAGYEPQYDVDKTLRHEFAATGKPIKPFETAADQIKLLANLPHASQLDLLHSVLGARGEVRVSTLVQAWLTGDMDTIASAVNGQMHDYYPDLYQTLLVDRNRNWSRQIEGLLKQHGTFFVAVGAGHLAGPDSLQAQLAKAGVASERVR